MDSLLERVSKALAQETSRRDVLKILSGSALAAWLVNLVPGSDFTKALGLSRSSPQGRQPSSPSPRNVRFKELKGSALQRVVRNALDDADVSALQQFVDQGYEPRLSRSEVWEISWDGPTGREILVGGKIPFGTDEMLPLGIAFAVDGGRIGAVAVTPGNSYVHTGEGITDLGTAKLAAPGSCCEYGPCTAECLENPFFYCMSVCCSYDMGCVWLHCAACVALIVACVLGNWLACFMAMIHCGYCAAVCCTSSAYCCVPM